MSPNIQEILVANVTGASMIVFLLYIRYKNQRQFNQAHEKIFGAMIACIFVALVSETVSFLIDGRIFTGSFFLQYLCNFLCLCMMVVVGFLGCLFVEYRIYSNMKRLKFKAAVISVPLIVVVLILISDMFGAGLIFEITPENCYVRGKLSILLYIALSLYLLEDVLTAHNARKNGTASLFFPIYCFIIPCIIGTMMQGIFYGISTGWLATAAATVFIYMELQTANYYIDGLSGLFNRQYMNFYLNQKAQHNVKVYGIMIDVNDFKAINDTYGHTVGDTAIRTMGKILSQSVFKNSIAMRTGGDEFIVFMTNSNEEECRKQMTTINRNIALFNESGSEPFRLSVSMGSDCFDGQPIERFISGMDAAMYEVKRKYHNEHKR